MGDSEHHRALDRRRRLRKPRQDQERRERPPAFQFYVKSWMSSTKTLPHEYKGVYVDLLAWSWDNGPLPLDDRMRALAAGADYRRFVKVLWPMLAGRWERIETGYVNLRLEQQRADLEAFIEEQSNRGKAGAAKRWQVAKDSGGNAVAMPELVPEAVTQAPPENSSPVSDLQSSTPLRKERSEGRDAPAVVDGIAFRRRGDPGSALTGGSPFAVGGLHRMHAWCCDRGLCVPLGMHAEFCGRLGTQDADARLRAWYPTVVARYAGMEIGDNLFQFWRNEFAAWVGTVTSQPSSAPLTRGAKNSQAWDEVADALEAKREERHSATERRPQVALHRPAR